MIDLDKLVPIEKMAGDGREDTLLLQGMYGEGKRFILSFPWCKAVLHSFFGCGVGGICAVFLFEIEPTSAEVDRWLWCVIGDLPPAYLVLDQADTPSEALRIYIEEMTMWVHAAANGSSVEDLIPVSVPPTKENAQSLKSRLEMLVSMNICGSGNSQES